jgi:thiamine biosynthesis lipoprotein
MKTTTKLIGSPLFRPFLVLLVLVGIALAVRYFPQSVTSESAEVVKSDLEVMGTLWTIQVVAETDLDVARAELAIEQAFQELHRIDALMSDWKDDSPLSAINLAAGKDPTLVPAELVAIISRGIRYGEMTTGAFDITWKAMDHLWHFNDAFEVPSQSTVADALQFVDFRKISITDQHVSLPEGFAIGLGGIAKGYAIDKAGAIVEESGFRNFLVNGGGDILARGTRGTRPWSIGIRHPRGAPDELLAKVLLSDASVVTSGDYERFRIVDGVRYHHIVDPRTGYPGSKCQAVTVVAETAEEADVLATAVFVLGHEKGLPLAASFPGVEAFVIDADGRFWMTDGFKEVAEFFAGTGS